MVKDNGRVIGYDREHEEELKEDDLREQFEKDIVEKEKMKVREQMNLERKVK